MNKKLIVKETFVNETEGYQFSRSLWDEAYADSKGELFRNCQKEYGRCVSRIYADRKDGSTEQFGWVFESKEEYEDAKSYWPKSRREYIRHTWVEFREVEEDDED